MSETNFVAFVITGEESTKHYVDQLAGLLIRDGWNQEKDQVPPQPWEVRATLAKDKIKLIIHSTEHSEITSGFISCVYVRSKDERALDLISRKIREECPDLEDLIEARILTASTRMPQINVVITRLKELFEPDAKFLGYSDGMMCTTIYLGKEMSFGTVRLAEIRLDKRSKGGILIKGARSYVEQVTAMINELAQILNITLAPRTEPTPPVLRNTSAPQGPATRTRRCT